MYTIDWGFIASWIAALSTFGLLCMAWVGYGQWRDQFTKKRDHDLAVRFLQAVSAAWYKVEELRNPSTMLSDYDYPPRDFDKEDRREWEEYKIQLTKYRSRRVHLVDAVEKRKALVEEADIVWGTLGVELRELEVELGDLELELNREVWKFVEGFRPDKVGQEKADLDVLFSPADHEAGDAYADSYDWVRERIRNLLGPKIRME